MPNLQPALPGMVPRGRPRSSLPKAERLRSYQAQRRRSSSLKSLSVEVDGLLLAAFKTDVSGRRMTMRQAVEAAIRNWIKVSRSPTLQKRV
jgi:hypothetical protein